MCTHPHLIWNSKDCIYQEVPCRVCMECRLDYTRSWAVRCMHEVALHEDNCFITLTFNDEYLGDVSLAKSDLQKFFKRLRKEIEPLKIKYFGCGEYGGQFGRKHYHAIIFNWYPKDSWLDLSCGKTRSPTLERLWPFGFSCVGDATYESARYVASYIVKQHRGKDKSFYDKTGIQPEFVIMSNGIGKDFVLKHKDQFKKLGYVLSNGYKVPLNRYYENLIYSTDEEKAQRKSDKLSALDKSQRIFEEHLNFDDYLQFAKSHKQRFGHDIKKKDWIAYKKLCAKSEREKRLNEKVNRTKGARK